uniref:Zmp:0000000846 n=1 Tax=Salarias fasciatus TaxID=181472 RepID=A0A672HWZ9_SALFA
ISSNAGLVKKLLRHRRQTLAPPSEHNVSLPAADHPVVFNHVYNINVPASSLCSVNLDAPGGTELLPKDAAAAASSIDHHVTEHTLDQENQIVFTHRINIPRKACGCGDDLPGLKDLMSRLEMLEGEVSALRDQCKTDGTCCSNAQVALQLALFTSCSHGRCDDGYCICEEPWTGFDCSELICPKDCYDRGRCENGTCHCEDGFTGEDYDCSELSCPNNCLSRGRCVNGQCVCEEGLAGEDCSIRTCPSSCYGRGECVDGRCVCHTGFTGRDCVSPPKDLTVGEVTTDTVDLSWNNEMLVTEYLITYVPTVPGGLQQEVTVSGDKTAYSISSLKPDTEYTVSLVSWSSGVSSDPVTTSFTTGSRGRQQLPGEIQPHLWRRSRRGGVPAGAGTHHAGHHHGYGSREARGHHHTQPAGDLSHLRLGLVCVAGLRPGTEYGIGVTAVNNERESLPATNIDPPRDFEQVESTETSVTVRWQKPQAKVSGYKLDYVSRDGQAEEVEVPATASSHMLHSLTPGMRYTLTLTAERGHRRSRPVSLSASTGVDPPRDLTATNIQTDSATLTWRPPHSAVTGYTLTFSSAEGNIRVRTDHRPDVVGQLYRRPRDCAQVLLNGETTSGLYTVYIGGEEGQPIQVYCDMSTDGGGWLVFLRRQNGKLEFFRNWKNYTAGFGNLNDEFWLGLANLHKITSLGHYELRVDLRDSGESAYAQYDKFTIAEPRTRYKLYIGAYSGTAGDSMTYHQGRPFSTYDNDNDIAVTNCALSYKGAFWYKNCHRVNLMGKYGDTSHSKGINWFHWKGHEHSIQFAEMKLRPANFRNFESRKKRS